MRYPSSALSIALLLSSCASSLPGPSAKASGPSANPSAARIEFIEDDYPRALAEAKKSHRALFVDTWAPWCHTCLSMRAFVFADPRLAPLAKDYVFLALDTENEENAPAMAKVPTRAWPTLWVLDPNTEQPSLKWLGSATTEELVELLQDAAAAQKRGDSGGEATSAYLRGQKASADGKTEDAIGAYKEALKAAPASWPRRARALEALITRLEEHKDFTECVALAKDEIARMPAGTSRVNVAATGLSCSEKAHVEARDLVALALTVARDTGAAILADDRSTLYESIVDALKKFDAPEAKRVAGEWSAFLDAQAASSKAPAARAVFDAHRLLAYRELGALARVVPALEASERDFPSDYNPPARLAIAHLELGNLAEAKAAADRALARAYGPRKLRIYKTKADVMLAMHDREGEKKTVEEAIAYAEKLALSPREASLRDEIAKRR